MAFNRAYQQPNPWASGAPPNQVMSGLMTGYQQPTGPQNHFAPNPTGYNLAAAGNGGISWNMPGNIPNGQLRMGQQSGWNQNVIAGNQQRGGNLRGVSVFYHSNCFLF